MWLKCSVLLLVRMCWRMKTWMFLILIYLSCCSIVCRVTSVGSGVSCVTHSWVYSPQKPSPGKRLKAGINTGANGVTALLGERDRKKHWVQTFRRLNVTKFGKRVVRLPQRQEWKMCAQAVAHLCADGAKTHTQNIYFKTPSVETRPEPIPRPTEPEPPQGARHFPSILVSVVLFCFVFFKFRKILKLKLA